MSLEEICKGEEFSKEILGNTYCMLKPTSDKVLCGYRSDVKDDNGMFVCDYKKIVNGDVVYN